MMQSIFGTVHNNSLIIPIVSSADGFTLPLCGIYTTTTVGLAHDYDQPEEVNVSERQGVRGHAGAHFKGFEE